MANNRSTTSVSMMNDSTAGITADDAKAKIRSVFGDSVMLDDGDDEDFFMYTPSPSKPSDASEHSGSISGEVETEKKAKSSDLADTLRGSSSDGRKREESVQEDQRNNLGGKENVEDQNTQAPRETVLGKKVQPQGYSQRSTMESTSRSSLPSELIQKTQAAIDKATISVSQSVRRPLQPKKQTKQQVKANRNDRDEWEQDLQEAKEFYNDMHMQRYEGLRQRRQLSSQVSREKAAYKQMRHQAKLQSIEEESQFKSSVHRDHQKMLRENEERRRRESSAVRAKLRENARAGMERLRLEKVEERQANFDDRHAGSDAIRKTRLDNASLRRKSYQFRNGDGRRIRELYKRLQAEQQAREHESSELERGASHDVDEYKQQLRKDRRDSFANRNKLAHQIRIVESRKEAEQAEQLHESFKLKSLADKDADDYNKEIEAERRASLRRRGEEFLRQRKTVSEEQSEEREAEHASYELKWDAEKDVERYRRDQERKRRDSLEGRNAERSRHAKVLQELELIAREQETESYVLKWAGEGDVKNYRAELKRERKESLQQRGREHARIRKEEEQEHYTAIQRSHEDEKSRADDQKDVDAYRRECKERDRASFQYRNKEGRKQRIEEAAARCEEQKMNAASFELETMARKDVEDYVKACKQRRRYSLAFRAKEKRRHLTWKEKQEQEERTKRSQVIRGRLMDHRYMESAEQQERAARAMEDIRHQHRLYKNKK